MNMIMLFCIVLGIACLFILIAYVIPTRNFFHIARTAIDLFNKLNGLKEEAIKKDYRFFSFGDTMFIK